MKEKIKSYFRPYPLFFILGIMVMIFLHVTGAYKGLDKFIIIACGIIALWKAFNFLVLLEILGDSKYEKCAFGIRVDLNMEEILNHSLLVNKSLFPAFDKRYGPCLETILDRSIEIEFIVKDNLIFVNGELSHDTSHSIKIPYHRTTETMGLALRTAIYGDDEINIVTSIYDGELVCYVDSFRDVKEGIDTRIDSFPIFSFPLAYASYEFNFHPEHIRSKHREILLEEQNKYNLLRKGIFNNPGYNKKTARLSDFFNSLKNQILEREGFIERYANAYRNKYAFIQMDELDHGLKS
jgi:hypothetical protein